MPRHVIVSVALALLISAHTPGAARAQIPPPACRSVATADTLIRDAERIAQGEWKLGSDHGSYSINQMLANAFGHGPCSSLAPHVDRGQAMARLLEYASRHDDPVLAAWLMKFGSAIALQERAAFGWDPVPFLFDAMESGRTAAARGNAMYQLVLNATDPQIRGRLLSWARRAIGPAAWPDLPIDLVEMLEFASGGGGPELWREIKSDPSLLANPRARWNVVCGRLGHTPLPPDDPCHPGNAPPRPSSGGAGV